MHLSAFVAAYKNLEGGLVGVRSAGVRRRRLRAVKAAEVAEELKKLLDPVPNIGQESIFLEWQAKVATVLRAAFGASSSELAHFAQVSTPGKEGYVTSHGSRRDWEHYRADAAGRGCASIRSAIYALEILGDKGPIDDASIDPELWAHVQGLIFDDDWGKVPAAVAIFLEDKVRTWAGEPTNGDGSAMVGQVLYAAVFRDDGQLRLGRQSNEWAGWRFLGQGLAQAIGNVDRHRIQQRGDVRRYAIGVLGLGSLLLTQMRYEHAARIQEVEAERAAGQG